MTSLSPSFGSHGSGYNVFRSENHTPFFDLAAREIARVTTEIDKGQKYSDRRDAISRDAHARIWKAFHDMGFDAAERDLHIRSKTLRSFSHWSPQDIIVDNRRLDPAVALIGSHVRGAFVDNHGMNKLDANQKKAQYLGEVLYIRWHRDPSLAPNMDRLECDRLIDLEIEESGWKDVTREQIYSEFSYLRSLSRDLGLGPVVDSYANGHKKDFGIVHPPQVD